MPSLLEDSGPGLSKQTKGTRKSERQTKPSTKWMEDVGFASELPKSAKKKLAQVGTGEDTSSKPLLISDWANM